MSRFHLVLSRAQDLRQIAQEAAQGKRPGHIIWDLSQQLGATIHAPDDGATTFDHVRAKICGTPEMWSLARNLKQRLDSRDVVYCLGEAVGIPVAALCGGRRGGPRVASFFHNIDRPRGRAALKLFRPRNRLDLFIAGVPYQAAFLRRYMKLPEGRVRMLDDQTDATYFTPGPSSPDKRRPLIASGGLERRDYRTLATATADLDADVKVCAFSPDASRMKSAFPAEMPANMAAAFYDWPELRQLYRDADVVALPLVENKYSAGLTTLLEAMACRRPVVATRGPGPIGELADAGALTAVPPGDAGALREAISHLLNNPAAAEAQAQKGYDLVQSRYNSRRAVEELAGILTALR